MKINGKIIEGPKPEVIVIPKGGEEFVFQALPVLSYEDFEKLCPTPLPPKILRPGGEESQDVNDKDFLASLDDWSKKKVAWMFLISLQATEGLEWETIDMSDPATWNNYNTELGKSFTDSEINLIFTLVTSACGLNQDKIDEATKRFLAGREQEQKA